MSFIGKLIEAGEALGYILFGVDGPDTVHGVRRKYSSPENFHRDLPGGTMIYGPKATEGRPGHRHGHIGEDFDRSPHSSIGSAAIGDHHGYEEHKRRTRRR